MVADHQGCRHQGAVSDAGKDPRGFGEIIRSRTADHPPRRCHSGRLAAQGAAPLTSTSEQTRASIEREVAKWQKVVREAGIKGE